MSKLLFNHPSDNIIANATITVAAGTVDPLYPIANLSNGNPALPLKFTTKQFRLVFDWGTPTLVPLPALVHHNLTVASRWEGNATDSWGAPTMSHALPIGTIDQDGYRPNLHLDLTALSNYGAFRYTSLVLDSDNAANVVLGELWTGAVIRDVTHNYSDGFKRADQFPGRQSFVTDGGVTWIHASIGRLRGLTVDFETSDAGLAVLRAWNLACGGMNRPTLLVPDIADGTDAWLARWTTDWAYTGQFTNDDVLSAGWLELARGPAI